MNVRTILCRYHCISYLLWNLVHKVRIKLMKVIHRQDRIKSEPFRTNIKAVDTDTTKGSTLWKTGVSKTAGDKTKIIIRAKARFPAAKLSTRAYRRSHTPDPYSTLSYNSHHVSISYRMRVVYTPERFEGTQQPEDAEDAEDARTGWCGKRYDEVDQWDDDQCPVNDVPTTSQVRVLRERHALSDHLTQKHKRNIKNSFIISVAPITVTCTLEMCGNGFLHSHSHSNSHAVDRNIMNLLAIYVKTRNTFCGTWYLPHSHVHN